MSPAAKLVAAAFLVGLGTTAGGAVPGAPLADDALTKAKYAFAYWRRVPPPRKVCDWPRATYILGVQQYYAATVDAQAPDGYARADLAGWGRDLGYQLCETNSTAWTGPCAVPSSFRSCADNQLAGATFIELYRAGLDLPNPRSQSTLQPTIDEFDLEIGLGPAAEGSWPIVDLTFMAMAPLSRLGSVTGDRRFFRKMFANWNASMLQPRGSTGGGGGAHGSYGLFNRSVRLFMRDDTHLWHDGYWGRGNGWAMLGLVDAIRFGDAAAVAGGVADPNRPDYIAVFRVFAARLVELQGENGAWRTSLLEPDRFPTPDATGSACFTRGLAFGVNSGLLAPATYGPAVRKAWGWLSRVALHPTGKVGFCQPAGGGAGHFNDSATSDFCVGMFLGAAAEVSRMAE